MHSFTRNVPLMAFFQALMVNSKTQAINDFAVFTTVALASLSAGALQHKFGWHAVNLGIFPLLLLIISSIIWLQMKMRLEKTD